MGKGYKILTREKRLKIEALHMAKHSAREIADILGVHQSTIYRELKRGKTVKRNGSDWSEKTIYSADLAQNRAEINQKEKGRPLKIGNDYAFLQFVEKQIVENKYSPAVTLAEIERQHLKFDTKICLTTLYNYIKKGVFLNITMAECPYHKMKNKQKKYRVQKKASKGTSITERPEHIEDRLEFGHWEMDTVVGKRGQSKQSFLVLTERKHRLEIIEVMNNHTAAEVVRLLDKLERKYTEKGFRNIFKTITVDNGTEFLNVVIR